MKIIYIGSGGHVTALNSENGEMIWNTSLSKKNGIFSVIRYKEVTLIEENDLIYAGCFGVLYCLESDSGKIIWYKNVPLEKETDFSMSINGKSIRALLRDV